ncbi:MAG: hypothetical protein HAW65_04890 [Alphaproteobacteria bacterium]|nr:hypothetical protein [Alphaproteobacteria bacterium]
MRYILFCLMFVALSSGAHGNALVADLSKDHISIRSDFSGETLLLFGAIDGASDGATDIAVVLRGPAIDFTLRKKTRQAGIWVNSETYRIADLPAFYAVVSTAPLYQIAPAHTRLAQKIGVQSLQGGDHKDKQAIRAFIRLREGENLYSESEGGVKLINGRLFRAEITLPAGMPIGTYITEFFAFRDGKIIGYQTGQLPVDTVGAGNFMYKAAHETPLLYGLGGVFFAAFLGWFAALVFRRRL